MPVMVAMSLRTLSVRLSSVPAQRPNSGKSFWRRRRASRGSLTYANEPREALRRLQKLLPEFGRCAGTEDRRTLRVRRDIATITGMSGDDSGARSLFESLARDYE